MKRYYVGPRGAFVDGQDRQPGEEIPEAASWMTLPSLVSFGSIVVIESDEEEPAMIDEEGEVEPEEVSTPSLSSLKRDELVAMAESLGLDETGTKAVLIERIEVHQNGS